MSGNPTDSTLPTGRVMRHIKLDDLLHLAAESTLALGILGSGSAQLGGTQEAYGAAIERHLELADQAEEWFIRVDSLEKAAVLIRFCLELRKLDPRLAIGPVLDQEPLTLMSRAAAIMEANEHGYQMVMSTYRRVRELRLAGDVNAAVDLATKAQAFFAATGAEVQKANFELEKAFSRITAGAALGAVRGLVEQESYWADGDWSSKWATRGRVEQAAALAHLALGGAENRSVAVRRLRVALELMAEYESWQVEGQVERLSSLLALADATATQDGASALEDCRQALRELESVRVRWTVVARSPSPLALVLRVALGELAGVLARIRGVDATEVTRAGLHVSVTAKHSGVAELIRTERDVLSPGVRRLLVSVVTAEASLSTASSETERELAEKRMVRVKTQLESQVSRLLASLVLPTTIHEGDVTRILGQAQDRVVLDYVHLPTLRATMVEQSWSLSLAWKWFRSCAYGPGDAEFAVLDTGTGYDELFVNGIYDERLRRMRGLVDKFESVKVDAHPAWQKATGELLPTRLIGMLTVQGAWRGKPIEVLLSPHAELSRLPWAALVLDDAGTRFVQAANLMQTPMLSTFTGPAGDSVHGPAMVRIVEDRKLNPVAEQGAWGLRYDTGAAIALASCTVPASGRPVPLAGTLVDALSTLDPNRWGLLYVTCHGRGRGFDQQLVLPEQPLTAGAALGDRWPDSVVLNACHVGAVDDEEDAEPMGFVIAAMAGGAREVIGAVHVIGAPGAAQIGASLIEGLGGTTPLYQLLNRAQRALIADGKDVRFWGSLAAFVR